jgi:hypothetical protein
VNSENAVLRGSLDGVGDREIGGEKMPTPLSFSSAAGKVNHVGSPCAGGRPCTDDGDVIRCRKVSSFRDPATSEVVDSAGTASSGTLCLSFGACKVRAITYAVIS